MESVSDSLLLSWCVCKCVFRLNMFFLLHCCAESIGGNQNSYAVLHVYILSPQ